MNTLEKNKAVSKEEENQMRKMRLQAALREAEKLPRFKIAAKKYNFSLKSIISEGIAELYAENPHIPTKNVIIYAIKDLDDDLPAQLVLEMAQFAIEEWEKISSKALEESNEILIV
jgi:hypothetical protein